MPLHRKIITLLGLGMLLMMLIVVLSLLNVVTTFSSITSEMHGTVVENQRFEQIAKSITNMSFDVHHFVAFKNPKYRDDYGNELAIAHTALNGFEKLDLAPRDREMAFLLRSDSSRVEEKAAQVFALADPAGKDRLRTHTLLVEIDEQVERMHKDLDQYFREAQALQISQLANYVSFQKQRVVLLFLLILVLSVGFLLIFGIYIHRKISVPLKALWTGATEISQGNLDYRIQPQGASDVARLAERFNAMALKLKQSYVELERKLLDRTNELAAIDSVALTLSQAASLKEMLSRSLSKILDSLSNLEPQGGVFLCDPDGETLRLVAHKGLPPQFVEQEETIKMGECLCGRVAQSGEIFYAEKGCSDPRHSRSTDAGPHAHIIIPIKTRGIVLGVVFLYPQKEFTLKPSDMQMLETIGNQLGMAVENLRFYAEVKESSEKFWDLFENSRDILFTVDTAGTLTAANKAAEIFSGYEKTELIGKSVLDFLTPGAIQAAKRLLKGEGITARHVIEFEVTKRDGSHAFVEMSARRLFRQKMPSGYQVSARDVTEQKLLREKLMRAERLGAIGEIVITVRHEINNPLTTVIGNIELLIERYGDVDRELAARLETVLNNALRIAEIVKQLKAIKRDKVVEYVNGISMTDLKQE